jgi:hypothetical protein
MNRSVLFVVLMGLVPACAPPVAVEPAAPVGPERSAVALTVYNGGRALVKDTRGFALEAGSNTVRFDEVTSGIIPGSVHVESGDGAEVAVVEQNFEYDLVSTDKLLQRYLGQRIQVTTESGEAHAGTLLAAAGDVILETADGSVTVLRLDQIRDYAFPELPEGLASRPSLLWSMEAGATGEQDLTVTYLTTGFGWKADYIVQLADDEDAVDLSGWVSVENHTEAGFEDARLKLVAGDVGMVPIETMVMAQAEAGLASRGYGRGGGGHAPVERSFFDYHLYELPQPVTLRSNETKQVEFVDARGVTAEVSYEMAFDGYWYGDTVTRHPTVSVELLNAEDAGLGVPLPAGTMRVYKRDIDGAAELVGESVIDHTPRDEEVSLTVGNAFDIVGEWKQLKHRVVSDWVNDFDYEAVIRNHKSEAVTVSLVHHPYAWGQWSVRRCDHDHERDDNNTLRFEVEVPADGETTLTYTVRNRW